MLDFFNVILKWITFRRKGQFQNAVFRMKETRGEERRRKEKRMGKREFSEVFKNDLLQNDECQVYITQFQRKELGTIKEMWVVIPHRSTHF